MWQLVGFFLGLARQPGRGSRTGLRRGQVHRADLAQTATKVVYNINIKRVIERKLVMGIADGTALSVDGREIYTAKDLRVGLFQHLRSLFRNFYVADE